MDLVHPSPVVSEEAPLTGYGFRIPNLPRDWYEYLKHVRESTGLSPWQVVILALIALKALGDTGDPRVLAWVEVVRRDHPKP